MLSMSLRIHPAVFCVTDRQTALTETGNQRDSMQDAGVLRQLSFLDQKAAQVISGFRREIGDTCDLLSYCAA
jgi:hypothetical protein